MFAGSSLLCHVCCIMFAWSCLPGHVCWVMFAGFSGFGLLGEICRAGVYGVWLAKQEHIDLGNLDKTS